MPGSSSIPTHPSAWLIRVPLVFSSFVPHLFAKLALVSHKRPGPGFHFIQLPESSALEAILDIPEARLLVSWRLPVHHSWPCDPQTTRGFVEKAAQALVQKFAPFSPQTILVGPFDTDPSQRAFRALASNLRGRALQLFSGLAGPVHDAEAQDPEKPSLFCLVGREGLYAGLVSPRGSGGFYPGGVKFIKQSGPSAVSRAGAKVVEALHHLRLYRPALPPSCRWLELGASPGGMTAELLARGWEVAALDRAPLDPRLRSAPNLTFIQQDVSAYSPPAGDQFNAILCDMNGPALLSLQQVTRLSKHLLPEGVVIFTLKLPGIQTVAEMLTVSREVTTAAKSAGLSLTAQAHLAYNRHEFTCFFAREV